MSMNFKQNFIQYVIDIVTSSGGKIIELENKIKVPGKDKLGTLPVIPFMPLVGVDNRQPILNMSKRMVYC